VYARLEQSDGGFVLLTQPPKMVTPPPYLKGWYSGNPVTSVLPGLCWKKRSAGEKPGGIPLRNPYCLSVASLRILGISSGFSAFGGLGPRPFVTFGAMPKVKGPHLVFD